MRKKWIGLAVVILILSIGAVAFAQTNDGNWSFSDMLPFMKQMHPNWSDQQLEQMYNSCHGPNGMMNNPDFKPMMKSNEIQG